ncbi:hypothetical protein BUE80_DR004270 [Diplocarpon rosae]|nr:hypothetical protein BUE80_DR004270 [Diplocarpon rosae]
MSSPFNTQLRTPHHIPGINLSTFNVPTFSYHLPSLKNQRSPQISDASMLSTPYTLQDPPVGQSFVTARIEILAKKNDQLRQLNSMQAEEIVDLKVSRAIVENDLKHAAKDKENILSTIGMVIKSVTCGSSTTLAPQSLFSSSLSTPSSNDKLVAQNDEIERYRKEVRALKARIHDLERDHEKRGRARERENDLGSVEREHSCLRRENGWGARVPGNNGRARQVDAVDGSAFSNTPSFEVSPPTQHPGFNNAGRTSGPSTSQLMGSWAEAEVDLPSTQPNSPTPLTKPVFDPMAADIGMCSLEDFLENDGFPAIISTQPSSVVITQNKSMFEDDRTIDQQLADNAKATARFENMPIPGVLKVGFGIEGAVRGKDYDATPDAQTQPLERRRHWNRPLSNTVSSSRGYTGRDDRVRQDKLPEHLTEPAFSRHGGLWDNYEDKNEAVKEHMRFSPRGEFQFPEIFKYGIQYVPQDTDSNFLRTVQLSNLPVGTQARDVLARVRGGNVLSVTIVSMGKIILGSVQARVLFKDETAALAYVLYTENHQISFGDLEGEDRKIAEITLIDTPTYPIPFRKVKCIEYQTRCIAVLNIPCSFSLSALDHNLACGSRWRADGLVEMFIDEDDTLHLEFSSIDIAGGAWAILTKSSTYRRFQCRWEKEPCAGEVEELAQNVKSRPPMFPPNWNARDSNHSGDEDDNISAEVRSQLAALPSDKVKIPSFSGANFQSSSWADEVNGDFSETEILPTPESAPVNGSTSAREVASSSSGVAEAISVPTAKPESPIQDSRKLLIGLAGSNYASTIPGFEHDNLRLGAPYSQGSTKLGEHLLSRTNPASRISDDPLRVKLIDLIASPSVSSSSLSPPSSAKTNIIFTAVESLPATKTTPEAVAENKKQTQLFQWFQASNSKKKRVYSAPEHEIEGNCCRLKFAQSSPGVSDTKDTTEVPGEVAVSNPDEILLDEDDQDRTEVTPASQTHIFIDDVKFAGNYSALLKAANSLGSAEDGAAARENDGGLLFSPAVITSGDASSSNEAFGANLDSEDDAVLASEDEAAATAENKIGDGAACY